MNKTGWLIPALISVIASIISLLSMLNIDLWRAITDFIEQKGSWELIISSLALIISIASVFVSYGAAVHKHRNIEKEKSDD